MYAHYTIFNEKNENLSELLNFVEDNFKQLQDKKAAVKVLNRKYDALLVEVLSMKNTVGLMNLESKIKITRM